jgi:hypothetical protein
LLKAYPQAFYLVNQAPEFRIFHVRISHAAEKSPLASEAASPTGEM